MRFPGGTESGFESLSEPEAVVVVPLTKDGDGIVTEQRRRAVGRVSRGVPASSVEPDDADPAAAARRERTEETGYEAATRDHVTTIEELLTAVRAGDSER